MTLLVAVAALVLAVLLGRRLARLQAACNALVAGGDAPPSFVHAVRRSQSVGQGLRRDLDALAAELTSTRAELAASPRHLGVVRYDAFDDLAGALSFSVALVDDAGDGVVLSSINGRSETRSYAKGLTGGQSAHRLSPEEREAVDAARASRPAAAPVLDATG